MIRDDGKIIFGSSTLVEAGAQVEFNGRVSQTSLGQSTYFGEGAGRSDDLTTNQNVGIGTLAGRSNTSGAEWIAVGYGAANRSTTGGRFVAIGNSAGTNNTTGNNWFGIGYAAGFANTIGNNWFALGSETAAANVDGSFFVAIGNRAARHTTTGSNFLAIGENAARYTNIGNNNTLVSNSIYLGHDTRSLDVGQTNEVVIGYEGRGLGTNTTRIGNANTAQTHLDGSLTLGDATLDASAVLDISSTTRGVLFPRMTTTQRDLITTPADGLVIYNTTTNKLQVRAAGVWVDLH
jgi:hypothetical protein